MRFSIKGVLDMKSIKIQDIKYDLRGKSILKNISLEHEGSGVIALLGPNGAGKTTLMRILLNIIKPSSGNVLYNGEDLFKDRQRLIEKVGYLPQNFDMYSNATVDDLLSFIGRKRNMSKGDLVDKKSELIEKFDLKEVYKKHFGKLSGGFKRRVGIAQALMGNIDFVIIDEPTVGLDPEQRFRFREYLSKIGREKTVIISTHIVEDIAFYSNRIAIINRGEVIFNDESKKLIEKAKKKVIEGYVKESEYIEFSEKYKIIEQSGFEERGIKIKAIKGEDDKVPECFEEINPDLESAYIYYLNNFEGKKLPW